MALHFSAWPRQILVGLGQLAFCDTFVGGVLILAAIAVYSPFAALGALLGASLGIALAYIFHTWNGIEKAAGLPCPNLAILGIVWGILIAGGVWHPGLFVLSVAGCVALELSLRPILAWRGLPLLSLPAVATVYTMAEVFQSFKIPFWPIFETEGATQFGPLPAIVLIGLAMVLRCQAAAIWTAIITVSCALISGWLNPDGFIGPIGLWGFVVAPAVFGIHSTFLAGSLLGGMAGALAALMGSVIWLVWHGVPMMGTFPPFLTPFVAGTWLTLLLVRWMEGPLVLDPKLAYVAEQIRRQNRASRPAVALTGAGASVGSGIPDYVSGAWLDPDVPVIAYAWQRFLDSSRCRSLYWDACRKFRDIASGAHSNAGHHALAALEAKGWVSTTITQNVDRLHQLAGSNGVVELHGRIDRIRCIACDRLSAWPPSEIWRTYDLQCSECGELLKPAVIAFGESIPPHSWRAAMDAIEECGVLLVGGTQLAVSSAAELVAQARAAGVIIVFVNPGEMSHEPVVGDIYLPYTFEDALPALARLLDCRVSEADSAEGNMV